MSEPITRDDVISALREVVAERGADYLYQAQGRPGNCVYVVTNARGDLEPSCIVGHVLYRLGVPLSDMNGLDSDDAEMLSDTLGLNIDPWAVACLQTAQELQDGAVDPAPGHDHSWGAALRAAEAIEQ